MYLHFLFLPLSSIFYSKKHSLWASFIITAVTTGSVGKDFISLPPPQCTPARMAFYFTEKFNEVSCEEKKRTAGNPAVRP